MGEFRWGDKACAYAAPLEMRCTGQDTRWHATAKAAERQLVPCNTERPFLVAIALVPLGSNQREIAERIHVCALQFTGLRDHGSAAPSVLAVSRGSVIWTGIEHPDHDVAPC